MQSLCVTHKAVMAPISSSGFPMLKFNAHYTYLVSSLSFAVTKRTNVIFTLKNYHDYPITHLKHVYILM